ncbi:MAG: phytanoyl-CoA dioxygenase family protein [Deltaproteobacteria bacterium]|nr:phytanoyl-CoA dioxygenase family protein [Deltaproteobacteria bacterium]
MLQSNASHEAKAASNQDKRLDAQACLDFKRQGYLVCPAPVLPTPDFARLRSTLEGLLTALPEGKRPEDMDVPHIVHPELFEFLFHKDVLDLVEPLLGPNIALFSSHAICKPALDGKRVPWHQDSFYWKHLLTPVDVVTVWLAIDPSDEGNGAMRVIPGTHGDATVPYDDVDLHINTFPKEIGRAFINEATSVTLALQPNHASLHAAGLFHGSAANTSPRRRFGYTMRYMSTAVKYNSDVGTYHQIYLARGRDLAGNTYGDPMKPRPDLVAARAGRIRKGH